MPSSNGSRGGGRSRRSRSSGRSRSRHRERRSHSRSHSRFRFKHKERNFPAAICNMITIVILCVAMAEPRWIYLTGGGCKVENAKAGSLHYLGVCEFFYSGMLSYHGSDMWYHFGPSKGQVLINCVDSEAVQQFKTVIALSFITILVSMIAFLLDLTGPSGKILQTLHRYAIFSIVTVVLCVVINVLCYLISTQVWNLQTQTKVHIGSKINVTFDISFYLMSAAGSMAVVAVACNCFRRYPMYEEHPHHRMAEEDDLESLIPPSYDHDMSPMDNLPPPPAYTPSPHMPSTSATPPNTASPCELPSYSESVTSTQALSATPAPQPSSASSQLSVNV